MARENGVWVEYRPGTNDTEAKIVRVESSEVRALRSAVAAGNRVTFVQFGETLAEALARGEKPKPPSTPQHRGAKVQGGALAA